MKENYPARDQEKGEKKKVQSPIKIPHLKVQNAQWGALKGKIK
jgi:hypothetical protein